MSDIAGSRNGGAVEQLLLEAELDGDDGLRPVLLELRALATEQLEPSAAVAALMVPAAHQHAAGPAVGAGTDELAARRRAKRRITLTTLSVAVSLAAGGAVAVASDQGIRDSIGQLNHAVSSFVSGVPANQPAETPAPVPAQSGGSASVPAPTAPAQAPTAPDAGPAEGPQNLPAPPISGPVHLPELPVPENLTPGVPGGPLNGVPPNGEGQPPALPLPATPPVPLPSPAP